MNINIDCKNEYEDWNLDFNFVKKCSESLFKFLVSKSEIFDICTLKGYDYTTISFDFLFCSSKKTHTINREYRNKDYPADIITFAVFADSPEAERFVLDGELYLGEIIIALDKMTDGAKEKNISKEDELAFFISHGIMHLLGFDHQTQEDYNFVVECQKKALESLNIVYDKI